MHGSKYEFKRGILRYDRRHAQISHHAKRHPQERQTLAWRQMRLTAVTVDKFLANDGTRQDGGMLGPNVRSVTTPCLC